MKSIIVGTAGHIDHGKTALVKALTGIDADRLEEEKRRGITIDLGFAHLELPTPADEKIRFGFVDVPGHERFVRNMLAGVGGIDLVLLVIAADEGIKPQTREHFDICRLLNVRRGITVLTKSDLVDAETLQVLRLELEDFLRGSFLDYAPIVPVSSLKNTGLDELKRELINIATQTPGRDTAAITRLPIDRVFTMKGFGTVVTGTLIAGTIRKEDELELLPAKRRVRVRGIQVHGSAAESAVAGERTAVNLVGVEKHEIERGMTLSPPGLLETTSRIDVKLSLLSSAKPLNDGARVHLHAYAMETIAEVRLHGSKLLKAGEESYARARLAKPALLVPHDRFIIRQFSPMVTIGGGVVLDATPGRGVPPASDLEVLAGTNRQAILRYRVWRYYHDGAWLNDLVSDTGWTKSAIESALAPAIEAREVFRIGDLFLISAAWTILRGQVLGIVEAFHRENPLVPGINREELQDRSDASANVIFDAILRTLVREKKIEVSGDLVHLYGRGVVMKDDEAESRRTIENAFASSGLKAPALKEVLAGLKIDKVRAQKIVTLLLRDKILVKVSDDLVFHESALGRLRQLLQAQKAKSPRIDVGGFKDITGVSRKYAIPLLEYLDRERVTKRVGDERMIL
jgi:selenocysteine-specific elongation factor